MSLSTQGIILKESVSRESDRAITILTSHGLIRAYAKTAKNIKSKKFAATALFCYSDFLLYEGSEMYIVDEASVKEVFFDLRGDIEKLSLAQYFCDVLLIVVPESADTEDILRLMLNSLYFLCKSEKNISLIKSVFELRLMTSAGFMPNLLACHECGEYESDIMYFDINNADICCENCIGKNKYSCIPVNKSELAVLRHIVFSDFKDIFNFTASPKTLSSVSSITERYVEARVERQFETLNFYNSVRIE